MQSLQWCQKQPLLFLLSGFCWPIHLLSTDAAQTPPTGCCSPRRWQDGPPCSPLASPLLPPDPGPFSVFHLLLHKILLESPVHFHSQKRKKKDREKKALFAQTPGSSGLVLLLPVSYLPKHPHLPALEDYQRRRLASPCPCSHSCLQAQDENKAKATII